MRAELSIRMYGLFWSKYRPAILQMMQGQVDEWKEYQFMKHELTAINSKQKGGFDFRLVVSKGKSVNNIRDSEIAKDLLTMLQASKTASDLMANNQYEIAMDKSFLLKISKQAQQ